LRLTKDLFNRNAAEMDVQTAMTREGEALQQAYASPEFRSAVTAFMERRRS
jgi:enoyl-CoA hydratase/carnithine racemase